MKDKTKVKARNVGKVAEVLAEDPNATIREIKKKAGVAHNTVLKAKGELSHSGVKDPIISYIVGQSKERLKDISKIFDHQIREVKKKVIESDEGDVVVYREGVVIDNKTLTLLKDVAKDDQARISVLGGDATNTDGGYKSIQDMTFDSLQ